MKTGVLCARIVDSHHEYCAMKNKICIPYPGLRLERVYVIIIIVSVIIKTLGGG